MRNKKYFLFDEKKEAEKIYKDGFPNNNIDYSKMYLIAKYIRQTFGLGKIRLEKELIKFCISQDINFNPIKESESIAKWVNSGMKYNLRKIDMISISTKEIDFLKTITNNRDKKILYTILLLSKALKIGNVKRKKNEEYKTSEHYYIHYNNFADIIHLSRLNNINENDLGDILHNYREHFTFYNPERELIRVNYINDKNEGDIEIKNLNNMADYYNILFEQHKPLSSCIICGTEIKKNNNKQKYCKSCAKIKNREQHKIIMQKKRAKSEA